MRRGEGEAPRGSDPQGRPRATALPGHEGRGHVGGIELRQQGARAAGGHGGCPAFSRFPPEGQQPWSPGNRAPGNAGGQRSLGEPGPRPAESPSRGGPEGAPGECSVLHVPSWATPASPLPPKLRFHIREWAHQSTSLRGLVTLRCGTRGGPAGRPGFGGDAESSSPIAAQISEPEWRGGPKAARCAPIHQRVFFFFIYLLSLPGASHLVLPLKVLHTSSLQRTRGGW